jgi:putative ABC transport system permease protein
MGNLRLVLKNMRRRKLRSALTILGVVVGMLTLTVFGAFSQRMNILVNGTVDSASSWVTVYPQGGNSQQAASGRTNGQYIDAAQVKKITAVKGVKRVTQIVEVSYKKSSGGDPLSSSQTVEGIDLKYGYPALADAQKWSLSSGRELKASDAYNKVVVIGSSVASNLGKTTGDHLTIRGVKYKVVGVLNQTMSTPDTRLYTALGNARSVLASDNPLLKTSQLSSSVLAVPKSGTGVNALATRIDNAVSGLQVYSPSAMKQEASSQTSTLNLIVYGIAIISLVVGTLSVVNTMYMSVSERTREIGIKKAVGARVGDIMREHLLEASVVGLAGAAAGLLGGWAVTAIVNAATTSSGRVLFAMTPQLAVAVLVIGLVIGTLAGIFPALKAARLDPVIALRAE